MSSKIWGLTFLFGVITFFVISYVFFSANNDKIEASGVGEVIGGILIVDVNEKGFRPKSAHIGVGDSIKWVNSGSGSYSITFGVNASLENLSFVDQILKPAETLTYKFEKPGNFTYHDKISGLLGEIEVK